MDSYHSRSACAYQHDCVSVCSCSMTGDNDLAFLKSVTGSNHRSCVAFYASLFSVWRVHALLSDNYFLFDTDAAVLHQGTSDLQGKVSIPKRVVRIGFFLGAKLMHHPRHVQRTTFVYPLPNQRTLAPISAPLLMFDCKQSLSHILHENLRASKYLHSCFSSSTRRQSIPMMPYQAAADKSTIIPSRTDCLDCQDSMKTFIVQHL